MNRMRILIAFEEDYKAYQDLIAAVIRALRPHVEISACKLDELKAEAACLGPDLVICSVPKKTADAASSVPAWLEVPTGHKRSAELCLGGEYSEVEAASIEGLLWAVDETERLLQVKAASGTAS